MVPIPLMPYNGYSNSAFVIMPKLNLRHEHFVVHPEFVHPDSTFAELHDNLTRYSTKFILLCTVSLSSVFVFAFLTGT